LNYPGKGGKYAIGAPTMQEIPVSWDSDYDYEGLDFIPKKGKEVELLNLIGEEGSKGFESYLQENVIERLAQSKWQKTHFLLYWRDDPHQILEVCNIYLVRKRQFDEADISSGHPYQD